MLCVDSTFLHGHDLGDCCEWWLSRQYIQKGSRATHAALFGDGLAVQHDRDHRLAGSDEVAIQSPGRERTTMLVARLTYRFCSSSTQTPILSSLAPMSSSFRSIAPIPIAVRRPSAFSGCVSAARTWAPTPSPAGTRAGIS